MQADHELNRKSWDQLAELHGQDAYYDSRGLIAGQSSLIMEEECALVAAVGDNLQGLTVLQLQCHLGFDAITLARRGAVVTGVDFSLVALEKAKSLSQQCGVDIDWVCADAIALPSSLHGRYDLVWATIGITCWIADLKLWMRNVASVLRSGGKLVLIDGVPGTRASWQAEHAERRDIACGYDYATPARVGPQVQFRHTIESVERAAEAAGLMVLSSIEHDAISSDLRLAKVERGADGLYRRRIDASDQTILCTMIAAR
jgi:SAM-dependent methyltransferase